MLLGYINKIMDNKIKKITWPTVLAVFIVLMMASSLITLVFDPRSDIDFNLKSQITKQLGLSNIGQVQAVNTRMIGPITMINLQFFKESDQLVSANAIRLFWFEPSLTCVSSSSQHIC